MGFLRLYGHYSRTNKTIMAKTGTVLKKPILKFSQIQLDFGKINLYENKRINIKIENTGEGNLEWEIKQKPNWVTLRKSGNELQVIFSPKTGGLFSDHIQISSNGSKDSISVRAEIFDPLKLRNAKRQKRAISAVVSIFIIVIVFSFIIGSSMKEKKAWKTAKNENTFESYKTYLSEYPKGKYVLKAETLQEDALWEAGQTENTINGYNTYLKEYPKGKYLEEAKDKLEEAIWIFLSNHSDERVVVYQSFSFRRKPYSSAPRISLLEKDRKVKVITKSKHKAKIEIFGYAADAYWYNVKLDDGDIGWVYGAGLKASEFYYSACNQYIELFPKGKYITEIKEKFKICDCNVWEETIEKESKESYEKYFRLFPKGIYSKDAFFLKSIINRSLCYAFSDSEASFYVSFKLIQNLVTGGTIEGDVMHDSFEKHFAGYRKGKIIYAKLVENKAKSNYFNAKIISRKLKAAKEHSNSNRLDFITFTLARNNMVEKWYDNYSKKYKTRTYSYIKCE